MTNVEDEAIKYLIELDDNDFERVSTARESKKSIRVILDSLDRQQREIEYLNKDLKLHEETSFEFQEENLRLRKEIENLKELESAHKELNSDLQLSLNALDKQYEELYNELLIKKNLVQVLRIKIKRLERKDNMRFKEFAHWCNKRACDGCWGMKEAIICSGVCSDIYKLPFWKREKEWQNKYAPEIVPIVEATNKKIEEVL